MEFVHCNLVIVVEFDYVLCKKVLLLVVLFVKKSEL